MRTPNTTIVTWRKSSYSTSNANCVEVAAGRPLVGVRDSKNVPGPALAFGYDAWSAFIAAMR